MAFTILKLHVRYCVQMSVLASPSQRQQCLWLLLSVAGLGTFFEDYLARTRRCERHSRRILQKGIIATAMVMLLLTIAVLSMLGALAMVQASLRVGAEPLG